MKNKELNENPQTLKSRLYGVLAMLGAFWAASILRAVLVYLERV